MSRAPSCSATARGEWPVDVERERRHAALHRRQAVERAAVGEAVEELLPERALVRLDRRPADRLDVLDRGDEAGEQLVRERAGLERMRRRAAPCTCATAPRGRRGRYASPRCGPKNLYGEQRRTSAPSSPTSIGAVRRVVHGVDPGERAGAVRELGDAPSRRSACRRRSTRAGTRRRACDRSASARDRRSRASCRRRSRRSRPSGRGRARARARARRCRRGRAS